MPLLGYMDVHTPYSLQKSRTPLSISYETVFEKFLSTWPLQLIKKDIIQNVRVLNKSLKMLTPDVRTLDPKKSYIIFRKTLQ